MQRLLKSFRLVVLFTLTIASLLVLILRHRSPTHSDRFYRARGGRFVQLDSRDHRLRLLLISDYPNDEPLSWKVDHLTAYLPGRAPQFFAPVPLLRLTPFNEESAGPLDAAKGVADIKHHYTFGGFSVPTSRSEPQRGPDGFALRPKPATKPAEKPPTLETASSFDLSPRVQTSPKAEEPKFYLASASPSTIIGGTTTVTLNETAAAPSTLVLARGSTMTGARFSPVAAAAPAPAWPYRTFSLPHSLVALVIGLYPLIVAYLFARRQIVRWRRNKAIHCVNCGYDIRATPDHCPECGTSATAPLTTPPTTPLPA